MKRLLYLIISLPLIWLTACDVHEWPELPDKISLHVRLNYETDMTVWEHLYDKESVKELGFGETYDNHQKQGKIRYIIRTYPILDKQQVSQKYTQEFVFIKDISEGYDHEVTLDLLPGNYNLMIWSDLMSENHNSYYNTDNFAEISLQGEHKGNTDYRDAFRGTNRISLVADVIERLPDTLDIAMQRPLAKFEFITNDVVKFIDKESTRLASKANGNPTSSSDDTPTRTVNLADYKVVFYYVGFMPDAYSINTDKPVDSSTGIIFESSLKKLTESEATIGFDYVFVNGKESTITLQIGIIDKDDEQLSLTDPIEVPLQRSHHTLLRGMFLTSEASGGIFINPEFDGDYNLTFN